MKKVIAIINLMPEKQITERQWEKLLGPNVSILWVRMSSHVSKNTSQSYLESKYFVFKDLEMRSLDGVILTGAPVEKLPFDEVDYWAELKACLDRVEAYKVPILAVCWGAQALMYHRFGVDKKICSKKIFGIFKSTVLSKEFMPSLGSEVAFPQSRYTTWNRDLIDQNLKLKILLDSSDLGPIALADERNNWYFTGHIEYGEETLIKEYERDRSKGLGTDLPRGYVMKDSSIFLDPVVSWYEEAFIIAQFWLRHICRRQQ